ncbi:hemolysin XhlA family protein [Mycoplana rhizolycopersici]|nr:hemolysin XhlA family protein [Rhizobium rhizolycopersici]
MAEDEVMEVADLRARNAANEQKLMTLDTRLSALEAWQRQMDIFNARRDEQFKALTDSFSLLNKKIDDLNGTLKWAVKVILGAMLAAVVAFMVKGGFHIPG